MKLLSTNRLTLSRLMVVFLLLIYFSISVATFFYIPSLPKTILASANLMMSLSGSFYYAMLLAHETGHLKGTSLLGFSKALCSCLFAVYWCLVIAALKVYYDTDNSVFYMLGVFVTLVKIVLSCFSENDWAAENPPRTFLIVRNVPFIFLAFLTATSSFVCDYDHGFDSIISFTFMIAFVLVGFYLTALYFWRRRPSLGHLFLGLEAFFLLFFSCCVLLM